MFSSSQHSAHSTSQKSARSSSRVRPCELRLHHTAELAPTQGTGCPPGAPYPASSRRKPGSLALSSESVSSTQPCVLVLCPAARENKDWHPLSSDVHKGIFWGLLKALGSYFYSINKYSIYENDIISKFNVTDVFRINLQVIFILLIIYVIKQSGGSG